MDIGAALRDARQRKGRSIRQVSVSTKIAVEILEKLERNQFEGLPGGLFRRGFLRAFAADVGLDPAPVIAAYRAQYETAPEQEPPRRRQVVAPEQIRLLVSAATVLVLVVGLAVSAWWSGRSAPEGASPLLPAATSEVQLVDTTARTLPSAEPADVPGLRFEATFLEPCWVSAVVDGVPVTYGTFEPGMPLVIEAGHEILLRVGNAGAVSFSINGHPGRSLGNRGQVVNVRIDAQTYKALVQVPSRTEA